MLRDLRKGVLFTLLFAGVVTPASADPILMFLFGMAREVIEAQAAKARRASPAPEPAQDSTRAYPGTSVDPEHLRRLIDDSFVYLGDAQRKEIFASLNETLANPKNASIRGEMIDYFVQRALTVRAAQARLAQLSSGEKQSLVSDFRKEIGSLSSEEQSQLSGLLRDRLLPIPSDLNQMLLAAFDAPR